MTHCAESGPPLGVLLRLNQAGYERFLRDYAPVWRAIAEQVATEFGLAEAEIEALLSAIRARLWADFFDVMRARSPLAVARRAALSAARQEALQLLPDDQRLRLVNQNRAKRRKNQSSAARKEPNSGTTAISSASA